MKRYSQICQIGEVCLQYLVPLTFYFTKHFYTVLVIYLAISTIGIILVIIGPESPRYLYSKKKYDRA